MENILVPSGQVLQRSLSVCLLFFFLVHFPPGYEELCQTCLLPSAFFTGLFTGGAVLGISFAHE